MVWILHPTQLKLLCDASGRGLKRHVIRTWSVCCICCTHSMHTSSFPCLHIKPHYLEFLPNCPPHPTSICYCILHLFVPFQKWLLGALPISNYPLMFKPTLPKQSQKNIISINIVIISIMSAHSSFWTWLSALDQFPSLLMVTLDVICFVWFCTKKGRKCNHQSSKDWNDLEVAWASRIEPNC